MAKDLTQGASLILEDLDVSGLGLYLDKDPTVPDDDYFDSGWRSFGRILYQRRSDEGIKYHTYKDDKIRC